MYIEPHELKTHAHEVKIKAIIQDDETIALACLDMAVEFATTKLSKEYDTEAIFSQRGSQRSPLLVKIIKDIAIWELIGLTNPAVDYNDKKFRYEQAVNWLNAVYKGMPANLPRREDTPQAVKSFSYHSNPKRHPHY